MGAFAMGYCGPISLLNIIVSYSLYNENEYEVRLLSKSGDFSEIDILVYN